MPMNPITAFLALVFLAAAVAVGYFGNPYPGVALSSR